MWILRLIVAAAVSVAAAGVAWADEPDLWAEAIRAAIGSNAGRVTEETIGRSVGGRPLRAIRVTGGTAGAVRPTVVIVAGLDGRHVAGARIAIGVLAEVIGAGADATARADLVVIPCVNPDGMARFMDRRPRRDDGSNASSRATAREDDDRDRRIDEDAPADLNGDGLVTQMRVKRPHPGLLRDAAATEVAEPDDPRLMRKADASKGESGEYAVVTEGLDADGDGRVAEDGPTGVDLESNFPYHWPEFQGAAGPTPLSESESRSLAEWLLAHPEVVAIVEYAPNDNLARAPESGKMDATGEAPISGGILDDDKPLYAWAAAAFKDATAITGTGGVTRSFDGSFEGWAYAQLGVAAFVTPGWVRPDLCARKEPDQSEKAKPAPVKTDPATPDKPPESKPAAEKKEPDSEDGKWMALSDQRVAAGGGGGAVGFVDWKPFDHPQLGRVEIGGWVPGFRIDAPEVDMERVKKDQTAFVRKLLSAAPVLEVSPVRVEKMGERVWKVGVSATNTGMLATRTAMGVRCRRLPPTRWEIDLPPERVMAGRKVQGQSSVAAGGQVSAEWVVIGDAGGSVSVKLLSPEAGDRTIEVKLAPAAGAVGGAQ